jgi:solute:Na+ symporter, SSS family
VAMFEVYYSSGFGFAFWNGIAMPLGIIFLLTGYCIYRFRETRAMTMGQFLEIRYNRPFRIFAATLQSISGVINYALFPAVSARFLIYYCDLPLKVTFLGLTFPTMGVVMAIFLTVAVIIVNAGGQITIMVTDCIQGLLSYPLYAIVVIYLLMKFSWSQEMAPALLDRPPGMSLLNPFDISKLRDFNLFFVLVGVISSVFNRMSWSGSQGYNAAALNAHEQKMGAVLGTWRAGFSSMMFILLAIVAYTFLNHANFAPEAEKVRQELAWKTVSDVADSEMFAEVRQEVRTYLDTGAVPPVLDELDAPEALAGKDTEPMLNVVKGALETKDPGTAQTYGSIYGQMRVPVVLRNILPIGITGVFCAICIFLLVSTDTTYMHSWGSIIVQDIILPIRGRPFTPKQQLFLLRLMIVGVAVFAFLFSVYFAQIDFIIMFFAITGAIWLGGAGACIVGGLYWKRGTTAGAFTALALGSGIATGGIVAQKMWVPTLYPLLQSSGLLPFVTWLLEGISGPFEPYIMWRVTPDQFPINSQEIYFLAMIVSGSSYFLVSWLTCREDFNMDRMLHRGVYTRKGEKVVVHDRLGWRNLVPKLLGINSEYTRGDKVLAWSVFIYSMGWMFGSFVVLVIWNTISPWPDAWWAEWFKIQNLIVPGIIGVVTSIWFTIGGTLDIRRLFRRLDSESQDALDDGRVIGHLSADDVEAFAETEREQIKKPDRKDQP